MISSETPSKIEEPTMNGGLIMIIIGCILAFVGGSVMYVTQNFAYPLILLIVLGLSILVGGIVVLKKK